MFRLAELELYDLSELLKGAVGATRLLQTSFILFLKDGVSVRSIRLAEQRVERRAA